MSHELPDFPSECLKIAIDDLRKCMGQPERFQIDMSTWHKPYWPRPDKEPICHVCLAGAVMAQTMGVENKHYVEFYNANSFFVISERPNSMLAKIDRFTSTKLSALNCFRRGFIFAGVRLFYKYDVIKRREALENLGRYGIEVEDLMVEPFQEPADHFLNDMDRIIFLLKSAGL